MTGNDNASAFPASEYDLIIRKSIPFYDQLHEAAINVIRIHRHDPMTWIDVGCGTGTFVERAQPVFPGTNFILTDPSAAMIEVAARKLKGRGGISFLEPVKAEELALPEQVDVATAIQSLHYLDKRTRRVAVENCCRLLKEGGIFITFENVRPLTKQGTEIGRRNWEQYEVQAGKTLEDASRHVGRFDTEFFPITVEEHLSLLREAGFGAVELLWYAYMQAGFYCIK